MLPGEPGLNVLICGSIILFLAKDPQEVSHDGSGTREKQIIHHVSMSEKSVNR